MFPSMVCPSASCSHRLFFFFLHKQADVENGLFLGGWRGDGRIKRTLDTREKEETSAMVLSSADVALQRSMELSRMMKSLRISKCGLRS